VIPLASLATLELITPGPIKMKKRLTVLHRDFRELETHFL
jgi:hypothetical protein